ncbi:PREDICTED: uncharacterized protein LOC108775280 [Cyphomyrmex costatus]|uniref:uncharacterized protein LOC108775280 n=1 Tax=Cyphomyrmex costatus TaxID=456900 RepID=UPI0008524348|nr:PREDICTED: uncharacterized protein LOC108775280 [Cyphomyrmex costatus]
MADIRITNLEDSIDKEVLESILQVGMCSRDKVRMGKITLATGDLGAMWIRLPVVAVKAVCKEGKISFGLTVVRVELFPARPLQCHKCLEVGHIRSQCKSERDFTTSYYKCGQLSHRARDCVSRFHCIVCEHKGKEVNHRVGSLGCESVSTSGGSDYSSSAQEGGSVSIPNRMKKKKGRVKTSGKISSLLREV